MHNYVDMCGEAEDIHYEGSRVKVIKDNKDFGCPWNYKVFVDNVEVKKVSSVEINIDAGSIPTVRITYLDD